MPPSLPNDSAPRQVSYVLNRVLLKAKYSFYSALVFFLFANPETSRIFQQLMGHVLTILTPGGALTFEGLLLLTGLFFLTMLGLMLLPSE